MTDLLEYGLARALQAGLGALPVRAARAAGGLLGRVARRPLGVRRETVEEHLARSFPERGPAWVEETARRCYVHFGREAAALARLSRLDPAELAAATAGTDRVRRLLRGAAGGTAAREAERGASGSASGRDLPAAAAAGSGGSRPGGGQGVLVVTGHLGNWELAGALLAGLGFDVSAVVKRQGNRRVHRRLDRLRRRLGVEPVPMSAAGRRLPRALSEGRVVALVADQDAGRKGVFVPFFGRRASTFRGPARLALEHRVPLVFGALVREGDGYRALARPVWAPDPAGGPSGPGGDPGAAEGAGGAAEGAAPETHAGDPPGRPPEAAVTRRWVAELERAVRARPAQYFWFHRRWKTRPEPDREGS